MTKTLIQIRILLATPSDLVLERDTISEVIRELNLTWPEQHGVSLELIHWETHTRPGASSDPQAVINLQLPTDYDVFMAMFWTRIGSPTPRAASGTIEEFERAYARWVEQPSSVHLIEQPSSVHLMVYFKTTPVSPEQIDPDQLRALKEFRQSLSGRGILYSSFDTPESLSQLLRIHLTRLQHDILGSSPQTIPAPPRAALTAASRSSQPSLEEQDEEEGFLDLIEESVSASQRATEVMRHFGEEMKSMTPRTQEATSDMEAVGPDDPARVAKWKRITNRVAHDMEDFVARTSPDIPILEDGLSTSLDSYGKVIALLPDFGLTPENIAQMEDALQTVGKLREAMTPSKASVLQLREIVSRLPRATTQFNRARRKYVELLDSFINTFDRSLQLIPQVEQTATGILNSYKDSLPPSTSESAKPAA